MENSRKCLFFFWNILLDFLCVILNMSFRYNQYYRFFSNYQITAVRYPPACCTAVYRGWRYQRLWRYNWSSWGWAACCSKHVEERSVTYILLKIKELRIKLVIWKSPTHCLVTVPTTLTRPVQQTEQRQPEKKYLDIFKAKFKISRLRNAFVTVVTKAIHSLGRGQVVRPPRSGRVEREANWAAKWFY